jgi:hypothetical protein
MESESEHTDYLHSSRPYMRLYEEEEADIQLHNAFHNLKSETAEEEPSWFAEPRIYIPLRFFKTIQGFHKVRLCCPCLREWLDHCNRDHWILLGGTRQYVLSSSMSRQSNDVPFCI